MNKTTLALLLAGTAAAQTTPPTQTVFINGVALKATPITRNGVAYYQLSADDLKRVGAITAGGVTPKVSAIRGCVGDTLFNGVYTVQLLNTFTDGDRFGATLLLANASKQTLHNFMMFSPSDVQVANKADNVLPLNNYVDRWTEQVPAGAKTTLQTTTNNTTQKDWTRLLIRPGADSIKELQQAKLPLAKVYNMEFDLTCQKK